MNKLTKLGLTALAGSLVAVSAQAGALNVNGSANMTYKTDTSSEGKGLGTDRGITFSLYMLHFYHYYLVFFVDIL